MIMSYEQLQDEVDKICNAISQGGGGGGSTVSVVSKRNTGENIADITVNGVTTQLYAPDSASDVSFDPSVKGVYTGTNTQSVVDEITDDIISLNDTTMKLIWVNPNPASAFEPTTIVFDTEYDLLTIKTRDGDVSCMPTGQNCETGCVVGGSDNISGTGYAQGRTFKFNTDKKTLQILSGTQGYTNANNGLSANNNRGIPYAIFGMKFTS